MLLPVLLLAGSCNREFIPSAESDAVLLIAPSVQDGLILQTRAIDTSDANYQENVINRLDVFFFNGTTLTKGYHLSKSQLVPETHGSLTGYPLSRDFNGDGLQKDVQYTVYVIANSVNDKIISGTGISTPSGLEELLRTEPEIYKRQKNDVSASDNTFTSSKSFLMNAKVDWTITESGTQFVKGETITLKRAAVKFVIDVSLSEKFKKRLADTLKLEYGNPLWKYQHLNSKTYEVPGTVVADSLIDSPGGFANYLSVEGAVNGHYTIVTYAYPQTWTESDAIDIDKVPAILLSFNAVSTEDSNASAYHYYYIPLCQSTIEKTESNNIYKVNAIISSLGSSEASTSKDVTLKYDVLPWATDKTAVIDAQQTDYIVAVPNTYVFKGGAVGSALTSKIKYYASGTVTLSGLTGFYIDKNGNSQPVTLGEGVFTVSEPSGNTGELDLSSCVPTNGTYREVQFILTCGTKSQVVKIRHYPLDFITAESGSYSTYDDPDWAAPGKSGSYASSEGYDNRFYYVEGTEGSFGAKQFYNGEFWNLGVDGNMANQYGLGDLDNRQMYILQLTSSNDHYTIGRPALQSNTTDIYRAWYLNIPIIGGMRYTNTVVKTGVSYSTSQDNFLSPAFMLGSQLGANGGFPTAELAAIHCALYKEVVNNVEYKDWRLPTKQEIQYMIDNQNSYGDVMDKVLGGRYYWALDGSKAEYPDGDYPDNIYTRCVHDLTAEELAVINQFE